MRTYYVYIMASRSRVLYTGVATDLARRVGQHKAGASVGFTSWHNVTRLVYVEAFPDMREAIAREKQIKGWSRAKTMQLIQRFNRQWDDLAKDWFREPLLTAEPKRPGP